jgi:excisionase family DNA binding protein
MNVRDLREPALLTTGEASRLLGVSPRTVARLAENGDLPAVRLGPHGRWRIIRAGVDRIVQSEPVTSRYGVRESVAALPREDT